EQVAPGHLARRAADDLHALAVLDVRVALLHEQAAEHPLVVALAGVVAPALLVFEDSRRRLLRQPLQRRLLVARREEHLDERLAQLLAERLAHGAVEYADAAVGRDRFGLQRAVVGLLDRARDGDAAG